MAESFSVSLAHCAKYEGQFLSDEKGWKAFQGECAAGVQYVFFKAAKSLGRTVTWKEGVKVKGNKITPGTAIATFRNGVFAQDHVAIFIKETVHGLLVWDQYNRPPKPWGKRTLYFNSRSDYSNNGNLFSTIVK